MIKGVTRKQSADIMHDYENADAIKDGRAFSSKDLNEQAVDREAAHQAKRSTAYELGYENMRRSMGFGATHGTAEETQDPVAKRRKQLMLGGVQANEAALTAQREASAQPAAGGGAFQYPESDHRRSQLVAGGLQPNDATAAVKQEEAARVSKAYEMIGGQPNEDFKKRSGVADAPPATPPGAPASSTSLPATAAAKQTMAPGGPMARKANATAAQAQQTIGSIRETDDKIFNSTAVVKDAIESAKKSAAGAGAAADALTPKIAAAGDAANAAHMMGGRPEPFLDKMKDVATMGERFKAASDSDAAKTGTDWAGPMSMIEQPGNDYKAASAGLGEAVSAANAAAGDEPQKRAMGGPVSGVNPNAPPKRVPQSTSMGIPGKALPQEAGVFRMKNGGKANKSNRYKVAEKGFELFMPNKKSNPPAVLGTNGPQVGQFSESGTVIPNHALKALKKKFSKQQPDDSDD